MSDPLIVGSGKNCNILSNKLLKIKLLCSIPALAFVFISFYFYFCTNSCQDNTRAQVVSAFQENCDIDIESDQVQSASHDNIEMIERREIQLENVRSETPPPSYETLFPESVAITQV